jgi:hypothetical protein
MARGEREQQAMTASDSIRLIQELLSPSTREKREFLWQEIRAAMAEITKTQTRSAEDVLLHLLELEGPIRLAPQSDIPSVMSPEDMLKSLAIQFLSRWTGRKHLKALERVKEKTASPTLSRIAMAEIEKLGGE